MDWSNRFTIGGFTVSYSTFHQMWEVIDQMDGIELSYRWFPTKKKAEEERKSEESPAEPEQKPSVATNSSSQQLQPDQASAQ